MRDVLLQQAEALGFTTVRFTTVGPATYGPAYEAWIAAGNHGEMGYLARGIDIRKDPRKKVPGAKTVMVLALQHHHIRPADPGGLTGLVARYAWGRDYHNLIGKRLKKLRRALLELGIQSWGGVDTAPILERNWATEAGLGFGGKNSVQILPARTSWMFLAVLFLDVEVAPDPPLVKDHCGRCTRCLTGCPTDAFQGPRQLDSRKCIAYWTIEAPTLAPRHLRPSFGRWAFGCDVCQEVCPHNVRPPPAHEDDFLPKNPYLPLDEVMLSSDEHLLDRYLGTPIRRPKGHGLKRNALIVLGNLARPGSLPLAEHGMTHDNEVVRAAAVWCLARLGAPPPVSLRDPSPLVQDELDAIRRGEVTVATPQ